MHKYELRIILIFFPFFFVSWYRVPYQNKHGRRKTEHQVLQCFCAYFVVFEWDVKQFESIK
jgi:hypothetical protein